jgi:PBP1b-binding outer membrane lipoprotein LpoB
MSSDDISAMLDKARKRPGIIHRTEEILESDIVDKQEQHVETEKGKYVVTTTVVRSVTRFTVVREFDPSASYQDAMTEFIKPTEENK